MKKSVVVATIALAALLLQGCAAKAEFRTLRQITSDHTLRVYVNPAGEPFAYASLGEARGSEVDFMRKFAESIGVEAVFTISAYDGIVQSLNTGEADVAIGKMQLTGESYPTGYSLPIAEDRMYIICRRGEIYGGFAALEGKKVGVLGESELIGFVLPFLPAETEPIQLQSIDAAEGYLGNGAVDSVLCMRSDARRFMEEYGDGLSCEDIVEAEPLRYAAVVARGNDSLLAALNGFITESMMGEASDGQEGQA